MNKPKVIGLLARRLSGKSTAAEHYRKTRGAKIVSFAGPLKRLAGALFQLTPEQLYGDQKEAVLQIICWSDNIKEQRTARQLLQYLGTCCREVFGEQFWVEMALQEILRDHARDAAPLYVIDDVRYVNEARAIATDPRIQGCVIKIEWSGRGALEAHDEHPSEAEVDMVPQEHVFRTLRNGRDRRFFDDLDNASYEFAVRCMPVVSP
jgi:hypothetical protein